MLLGGIDLCAVAVAFIAAFNAHTAIVRQEGFYVPRLGLVIVCGLWLISARIADAYDLRTAADANATVRVVLTTLGLCFMGLLVTFLVVPYRITRPTLLLWLPFAAVTVFAGRYAYRRVFAGASFAGRVALVIEPEAKDRVWPEVARHIGSLYHVVGVVDPSKSDCGDRLRTVVGSSMANQIVLGVRDDMSRDLFRSVLSCHDGGVAVRSMADLYEEATGRLLLDQLGHTWLTALPMRSETSRLYSTFKRATDIAAACIALAGLAVVLPIAGLCILIEDGGPLFHRQERVGQYGRTFTLTKLRTMRHDANPGTDWTGPKDPRVTRTGRVLRRLHLDELPQGWSILRGDMSVIGPRPEQPHYVEKLRGEIDYYNTRLTVRPGLTGWAQVNFGYGSGVAGARVKLSYDLYYIKRQGASLDLLILGRTLMAVLSLGGR